MVKIAITHENGEIFQHFGKTAEFKVYEIENGAIVSSEIKDTMGRGHGELINVLREFGVSVLICGGIGGGARNGLMSAGIEVCSGNSGSADEVAKAYAEGTLNLSSETTCDHHGEDHVCNCGKH